MSDRVFISHASPDAALAQRVVAALEAAGISCWLAARDVAPGANFQEEIVRAIRTAAAMVLVFSAHTNRSGEMKKELALASQRDIPVIPLRVAQAAPDDAFAYELATRQWVDLAPDEAAALRQVADRLRSLAALAPSPPRRSWGPQDQKLAYCRSPDGVRLAYATIGEGPPVVKAGGFMSHLGDDWPVTGHIWGEFARDHTLLRYDPRGTGLSDWDSSELSLAAWLTDLETVVDAAGVRRFALIGISQGCHYAVAYAAKHPERVSHLILFGGGGAGIVARGDPEGIERHRAFVTLTRLGWTDPNSQLTRMFAARFIPDASHEQAEAWVELMGKVSTNERAAEYMEAVARNDVRELLPRLQTPTLVLNVRGDLVSPVANGRAMAAAIPGARFVSLPGRNHVFRATEPAHAMFFEEVRAFLAT